MIEANFLVALSLLKDVNLREFRSQNSELRISYVILAPSSEVLSPRRNRGGKEKIFPYSNPWIHP